ncbi:MAG: NCS2 family permease [Sphingomonadales bacterium]
MKPFVKGDWEGLFALGLDNLLVFLLMSSLCLGVLQFSDALFFNRILPATVTGLIIGNLFYAREALKLARREGRDDVCALPFGASVLTIIVFGFLVMLPTQQKALADGLSKEQADIIAWHAGVMACIGSGLIEFFGAFVVHHIRRVTPRPALLVTIAGIGLTFISLDFVFRSFAFPLIGFTTLALTFAFYFGGMKVRLGVPAGALIIGTGTAIAWLLYAFGAPTVVPATAMNVEHFGFNLPIPVIGEVIGSARYLIEFLPIFLPMGFVFLLGSLQNIESAAAAGDSYAPRPALMVNGIGTLVAGSFGSPFPLSIYLGHPGYKKMGSRAGYSSANGIIWTIVALTGTLGIFTYLIPIEAGMAILIWIGMVMCAQPFQVAEKRYMPAVAIGLVPAIAAYAANMVKAALVVAGTLAGMDFFTAGINDDFVNIRNVYSEGLFALAQGYLFTCMILTAATMALIDRQFRAAGIWFLVGAALSGLGFIHAHAYVAGDVIGQLAPNLNKWTIGYLVMALVAFLMLIIAKPNGDDKTAPATIPDQPRQ